ncbi:MAG: DUF47 family protein [Desulfobacteraceae bacterium]|nr:DUF47 family protein [Desulfobacteraceae bacterium]
MPFRLLPKSSKFFDYFREQNRIITEAASALGAIAQGSAEREAQYHLINRLESEGDAINRAISHELSSTFITPIDREDIHDINVAQEMILNHIQAITSRVGVYEFPHIRFPAKRMISNLKAMVTEIGSMLANMSGKKEVSQNIKQVKDLKNECEMLLLSGLAELYDNQEPDNAAILEAMKWTHVYDRIDKAVMRTWGLAKSIEGIVIKNA